jgi:thiol-disulfide isomerase/thioredoxin
MKMWCHILLSVFFLLLGWEVRSQSLVATDTLPKNVVLEKYGGIRCGFCPAADELAQEIRQDYPNRVVVINIHQGSFAVPQGDEPDYRTVWGDALADMAGVYGYPMGTLNRHLFDGDEQTAMVIGSWRARTQQILEELSPVNIGIQSTYDSLLRELTVHVELFYTATSPYSMNFLNVVLIQNHIIGPQLGGSADNYDHMYLLRDMITGQWGDTINVTTAGTFFEKDYVYQLPEAVNEVPVVAENCQVAVFVSETQNEIYTGDVVDAINGSNMYIGSLALNDTMIKKGTSGEGSDFLVTAESALEGEEEFLVTLEKQMPGDWDVSFTMGEQTFSDSAVVTLIQDAAEPLVFHVIPGDTAAFASYTVKLGSLTHPEAPYRYCHFYVISGVTDLVVNGTGGENPENYDYVFTDGLERAGCRSFAVLSADYFVQGMNDRAFGDVRNVYVNIAWSFPTLTISQLNALMGFMDNGGNLLISGQDIGWDFMSGSAGSHNSPEAADFYTNYLKAGYISDGTSADYIIYANSHDNVYDQVPDAFLIDIYDGNMYPDNVMATQGADEVFYYQSNNHAAVVKSVSDIYKTIYFACGLEMIGQPIITNEIMKLTYQWFNGLLSEEEYDEVMKGLFAGESSPNPAHEYSHIPVHLDEDGTLVLFNSAGQIIRHVSITKNNRELILDVSGLEPGVYFYRVTSGNRMTQTRKLVVY